MPGRLETDFLTFPLSLQMQTSTAVIAQANSLPNIVLRLLNA